MEHINNKNIKNVQSPNSITIRNEILKQTKKYIKVKSHEILTTQRPSDRGEQSKPKLIPSKPTHLRLPIGALGPNLVMSKFLSVRGSTRKTTVIKEEQVVTSRHAFGHERRGVPNSSKTHSRSLICIWQRSVDSWEIQEKAMR